MHEVFKVTREIPELGAHRGDLIVTDSTDPIGAVTVLREHGPAYLAVVEKYSDRLRRLDPEPAARHDDRVNRHGELGPAGGARWRGRRHLRMLK